MKLINNLNMLDMENNQESVISTSAVDPFSSGDHTVYRELDDSPVQSVNELDRLSENIKTLSELNARLAFITREVEYLLNIKKC